MTAQTRQDPKPASESAAVEKQATLAAQLSSNPIIEQAIEQLVTTLIDTNKSLTQPKPAIDREGEKKSYEQLIHRFQEVRSGKLFYPFLGSGIGRGPLVELADGSVKYDMITGIGVHYFGHSHPGLTRAMLQASLSDTVMAGNLQQNTDSVDLCEAILRLANRTSDQEHRHNQLSHCFLTSSGAMANENAFKLAFHQHPGADRILALEGCFCGRTMMLSQITDRPNYRVGLPNAFHVDYLPAFDSDHPADSSRSAMQSLKRFLSRYPGQYAAIKLELISGEGGFYPGDEAYFRPLIEMCREHGVAVLIDEIQTFGRTSQPFAFQHFNLQGLVDIVTIGKLSQVCATLFTSAYRPKPGLMSQTFTSSASAIAAARWIIDAFERGDLFGTDGRIAKVHRRFVERFEAIAERHPGWLRGPYGLGGMIACTPFDGDPKQVRALLDRLFEAGVMAFMAGSQPTRLRMLPPIPVLSDHDIDNVCELLEHAFCDVAEQAHFKD